MSFVLVSFKKPFIPESKQPTNQPSVFTSLWALSEYLIGTQSQPQSTPNLLDTLTKRLKAVFRLRDDQGDYSLQLKFTDIEGTQFFPRKADAKAALTTHNRKHFHILFDLDDELRVTAAFYKRGDEICAIPQFLPFYTLNENLPQPAIEEAKEKGISLKINPDKELFRIWAEQLPTTQTWPTYFNATDLTYRDKVLKRLYRPVGKIADEQRVAQQPFTMA